MVGEGGLSTAAELSLGTRKPNMGVVGDFLVPSPFLLFIHLGTSAHGMGLPAFRMGIPGLVNLFRRQPHSHAYRCVSR